MLKQTTKTVLSPADQLLKVNEVIRQSLNSDVPLINQVSKHIIEGGGKRMRPQCLINLAGMVGGVKDIHYQLAAIIEFIHTATLLHDDVVDESEQRRHSQTANVRFGNSASILVGDFIYSRSFQMMVELNNIEIMDVLAYTTNKIAEGEVLQLINKHNVELSDDQYNEIIQSKTGVLFEACGKLASIGNQCTPHQKNKLAQIGRIYGHIYQLVDDLLDYSGEANIVGKNLGDDLKDGKMTLPLLIAYRNSSQNDQEIIKKAINQGDVSQLTKIFEIIKKTNAIQLVQAQIQYQIHQIEDTLNNFDNNEYKKRISAFFENSLNRKF
ncbi:MAG: polyprenyl synthetase family protein [Methylophilaceae bacterium]